MRGLEFRLAGLAALAIVGAMATTTAQAADEACVRVLGYESDGEKQSMDPAALIGTDNVYHVRAVYEPLVDRDTDMQPIPALAESWESNADGTVWTFHLRQGVKFHDGSEFDAADVVYSYRRLLDPAISPGGASALSFLQADGIEAVDAHTVRFTVKSPVVELPLLIATKYSMMVPEGAKGEDLRLHGIGTGPFMQEQFTINAPVRILRRNPNYWRVGLPKAECLQITVSLEPTNRLSAILSGAVDLALAVDPPSLLVLKDNPEIQLVPTKGGTALFLAMWTDTPPYDDVRVRKAMKLVVDRNAIVQTALLGYGEAGNDAPVPPSSPLAYRSDLQQPDIAEAKRLLAEAGHPNGIEVELFTSDSYPGMLLLAQAYAEMAAPAGIKVNVVNSPSEGYWDNVWLKRPLVVSYLAARPVAEALTITLRSDAKWNETHWFRKDFDALVDQAGATVDPDKRRAIYQKAQELVAEEGGMVLPAFTALVSALRKGCTGFQPHVDVNRIDYSTIHCEP